MCTLCKIVEWVTKKERVMEFAIEGCECQASTYNVVKPSRTHVAYAAPPPVKTSDAAAPRPVNMVGFDTNDDDIVLFLMFALLCFVCLFDG